MSIPQIKNNKPQEPYIPDMCVGDYVEVLITDIIMFLSLPHWEDLRRKEQSHGGRGVEWLSPFDVNGSCGHCQKA